MHVSVAACLTAQALNIGYAPVAKRGVPALEPDRLAHVSRAYLSALRAAHIVQMGALPVAEISKPQPVPNGGSRASRSS
jgi:Tn3 transposase DDE domain